jgi:hypothetical protein
LPVEIGNVAFPDWKGRKKAFVLSLGKALAAVGIEFDGADGSPAEQFAAEYASTSAREKSQLIQFYLPP